MKLTDNQNNSNEPKINPDKIKQYNAEDAASIIVWCKKCARAHYWLKCPRPHAN